MKRSLGGCADEGKKGKKPFIARANGMESCGLREMGGEGEKGKETRLPVTILNFLQLAMRGRKFEDLRENGGRKEGKGCGFPNL